jgi:hypothetical protein
MGERPILMSGPLVREILAGRKDVTRRPVKNLRVRLRHKVSSDLPAPPGTRLVAPPDAYWAEMNQHGAVSIRCTEGRLLGVKPQEFDFLCPYADGHTYLRTYPDGRALWNLQPDGEQRLWVRETFARVPRTAYWHDRTIPHREHDDEWAIYREGWERSAPSWKPSIHMPRWACRLVLEVVSIRVERLHEITEEDARREGVADRAAFAAKWREIYGAEPWDSNPWVWRIEFHPEARASLGKERGR